MNPQDAIKHYRSAAALAEALGVSESMVHRWVREAHLPMRQVARLAVLTAGKVPITREARTAIIAEADLYGKAARIADRAKP